MSKQEVIAELETVLDPDHAQWVWEHRKTTIKKPLTVRAAQLLCRQFSKWHDPNEAADMMIERCWQGFKADWMPTNNQAQGRSQPRRGGFMDAIIKTGFGMEQRHETGDRADNSSNVERFPSQPRHGSRINH